MASFGGQSRSTLAKREAAWVMRLFNREAYPPEFQELKFTLHRNLLNRINLEAMSMLPEEQMRNEIRTAVARLVEEEQTPLSLVEKDQRDRTRSWTRSSGWARWSRCFRIPP